MYIAFLHAFCDFLNTMYFKPQPPGKRAKGNISDLPLSSCEGADPGSNLIISTCNKTVPLTGKSNDEICSENFGKAEIITIYSINLRASPHIELSYPWRYSSDFGPTTRSAEELWQSSPHCSKRGRLRQRLGDGSPSELTSAIIRIGSGRDRMLFLRWSRSSLGLGGGGSRELFVKRMGSPPSPRKAGPVRQRGHPRDCVRPQGGDTPESTGEALHQETQGRPAAGKIQKGG
jgi:hypothetical protein